MADDVGATLEMTTQRKPRDNVSEGSTAKDAIEKNEEASSHHGSKAERVGSGRSGRSGQKVEEKKPDPSKLKVLWDKLGLDMGTVLMMFKYVYQRKLIDVVLTHFFSKGEVWHRQLVSEPLVTRWAPTKEG